MDSFLKSVSASVGETEKTDANQPPTPTHDQQKTPPTTSELFTSAKVVVDAAKAKYSNQEFDQTKVEAAGRDLLGAASHYGKLEEKGYGKYVDKAEDYLNQYSSDKTTTNTATVGQSEDGKGDSGSGIGDYTKMAGDFLKKN